MTIYLFPIAFPLLALLVIWTGHGRKLGLVALLTWLTFMGILLLIVFPHGVDFYVRIQGALVISLYAIGLEYLLLSGAAKTFRSKTLQFVSAVIIGAAVSSSWLIYVLPLACGFGARCP